MKKFVALVVTTAMLLGCVGSSKPFVGITLHLRTEQNAGAIRAEIQAELRDMHYALVDKRAHVSSVSGESTTYFFKRDGNQCIFTLPVNEKVMLVEMTLYPSNSDDETFIDDGKMLRDRLRRSHLPIARIEFNSRK